MEDLEYDSDEDQDFANQIRKDYKNPKTQPPRDLRNLKQKCKETSANESVQVTPRPLTPPASSEERKLEELVQLTPRILNPTENEKSPFICVQSPLTKYMKRKAIQLLLSQKPKSQRIIKKVNSSAKTALKRFLRSIMLNAILLKPTNRF